MNINVFSTNEHIIYYGTHELFFNRKFSSAFHLVIAEYPSINRLNEDYESIQVEGRSGSLIINKGTYGDRSITIKLRLVDVEYMWNRMDDIEDWLYNVTDNRMYFERRDRCWRVKKVRVGDIKRR